MCITKLPKYLNYEFKIFDDSRWSLYYNVFLHEKKSKMLTHISSNEF